jgi:predicted RNA-binding protein with PUA domain
MIRHFKNVEWGDAVLILNYDKNNIPNYIGANTFLEMGVALYLGKKIFLLNEIPEVENKEEILGMKPVVINNNLKKIE